jgi:glycosyltransferase involved in cell wall biosynthesis
MKILNVNMSIDPVLGGGTAERTMQISRAFIRKGHKSAILTTNQGLNSSFIREVNDLECIIIRNVNHRYFIPIITIPRLISIISRFDIVHITNHWNILNSIVTFTALKIGVPYIITPAGSLHVFGRSRRKKALYNILFGKKIVQNASGRVAVNANEYAHYKSYGISKNEVVVIPNGVDPNQYYPIKDSWIRAGYDLKKIRYILFMGRLNKIKGPDILLKAFLLIQNQHRNMHIIFAGPDGGMMHQLKELASANNLNDRLHFVGFLGSAEKLKAYYNAEFIVIPSRQEAMSIVVLEAGMAGKSVLMTDQCGFNIIQTIGGGHIVKTTISDVSRGLTKMLSDRSKLEKMGNKLRKYVYDNYLWDSIIGRYELMISNILIARGKIKK